MMTTFLSYVAENDAKAINAGGAIRMATYRINYIIANDYQVQSLDDTLILDTSVPIATSLTDDMDGRLNELAHYQTLILNDNHAINDELKNIQTLWQTALKPAIINHDSQAVFTHSIAYVNLADQFVHRLQSRNENRQSTLQAIQVSTLVIIGLLLTLGIHEINRNVMTPIKQLHAGTRRFSKGKKTTLNIAGYQEFNDLGNSFNNMASTIYEYKQNLQNKVDEQTYHLTQANHALRLLYDFANQVNRESVSMPKLYELVRRFSAIIPNIKLSLCIHGEQNVLDNRIAIANLDVKDSLSVHSLNTHLSFTPVIGSPDKTTNTHQINTATSKICKSSDCDHCELKKEPQTYIIPIFGQNVQWGELLVQDFDETGKNFNKHQELLYTLANLIAIVFNNQKQRQQEDQLILEEERKAIARELHDSIAQSLTYLKMKLAMLGNTSRRCQEMYDNQTGTQELQEEYQKYNGHLQQAKEGLDKAYRQLRELLVTFRLSIEEGDFDTALTQACDEFAEKGGFNITLNNRVLNLNLTANEQIHLLQITREALSNIWRHAGATEVVIEMFQQPNSQGQQLIYLSILDNGKGLDLDFDSHHHHGLTIMRERTDRLSGHFSIQNNPTGGTMIKVSFLPKFFNR
ncbi:MAG: histidine kinase [Moraxella sp.]|nr:histidine kinase [Moraxella sp.]